ncbi:barstar family protein [Actinoplanes sp. Pm04-4]|uniref:Barstar family protein n=1 Tax=Paractinoplanes pyxinae TaxID=2997416 RepID=A0ABT4B321_9ACTN|nr:barstar family protein [Actinoplanes pyxinae]MCY1140906.1 barstar family protein [Actinoplanes pyxinae]
MQLDGNEIRSEADFHRRLAALLDFGPYYGHNLAALWDRLTTDVPRPVHLVWASAEASRAAMGAAAFERIDRVLREAAEWDAARTWTDHFTYEVSA